MPVTEIEPTPTPAACLRPALRFDRNEVAGAFGDIGTDLPLVVGMVLAAGLDSASVLVMFGAMQVLTGVFYRLPMPVQPLKAVAVLVITQKAGEAAITGDILYGGGLAIGIAMLLLTVTGLVDCIGRVVPKAVIRGIQFGLGLQLSTLALKDYLHRDGARGYALAVVAFALALALLGNRRFPSALFIIALGAIYACVFKLGFADVKDAFGFTVPRFHAPSLDAIQAGFLLLALPQIPLSIGNSLLAARQTAADLFPGRAPSLRKISLTYSAMNLVNPFLGGVPTCHGSGGLAGHYAFGARTGGSVVLYGGMYLVLGLFLAGGFAQVVQVFPMPVLGVILLFEGLALMLLVRDMAGNAGDFFLVVLVGLAAAGLPYGYLIGIVAGTLLARVLPRNNGVLTP